MEEGEKSRFPGADLDFIYATAPLGLAVLDADLRYLRLNERFAEINGVSVADHLGKTVGDVVPHRAKAAVEIGRRVVETGEAVLGVEVVGKAAAQTGLRRSWTESWLPQKDAAGRVVSITVIAEETTAQRQATAQLRAANEELSNILESISDAFYALDENYRFTYANRRATALWNKEPRELLGRTLLDVFPHAAGSGAWEAHRRANERREPVSIEVLSPVLKRWLALSLFPRPGGGLAVYFHELEGGSRAELERLVEERTAQLVKANERLQAEIAERKHAEAVLKERKERYRNLYDRTPMALHSVNARAEIIEVNDHWLKLFGYRREDVLGRSPPDFMTEDSARVYRENAWPDMLASDGGVRSFEYRFVKSSGEVFDGRLSSRGEWDAEGRFVRTWAATADITAEKRAEADLLQAQKMEVVGQLTGGIAHDFNNLLTVISGNLDLIEHRIGADPGLQRLVAAAQFATERGGRLTEHLLAFSRRKRLRPEMVDLRDLVRSIEGLLKRAAGEAIEVEVAATAALWRCEIDPPQLETALLNLALNARDAMPGGGKLTIDMRNVVVDGESALAAQIAAGPYVKLTVSDTGAGMPAEIIPRVFEPFFTTKEVGKGTGLGLSMVYGFIKQSRGHVAIESAVGAGTKVILYLPKSPRSPGAEREVEERRREQPKGTESVLVVEDDAAVLDVVSTMLTDLGYDVVRAAAAGEALDLLEQCPEIDLLLTDVVMPGGMSGIELARKARSLRPRLNVLLMSGYAEDELLEHEAHNEFAILGKPLRQEVLARLIRSVLAEHMA